MPGRIAGLILTAMGAVLTGITDFFKVHFAGRFFLRRRLAGLILTAMRKKKSEKGAAVGRGNPDYSTLRVVSGHYIERDVHALIDEINRAGGLLEWSKRNRTESSSPSEGASDKPHRSSEEPA